MIAVSKEWQEAQNQTLLPEMFVELSYMVTDPGVQHRANVSGSNPELFCDTGLLMSLDDKTQEKYASLDYGSWGLNGTFSYFNESVIDPGYVDKEYSDADGFFQQKPRIILMFPQTQDVLIPGITIDWGNTFGGWATDFRIRAYYGNAIVGEKIISGNTSTTSTVLFDLINYTRIEIEVERWSHPYQRLRCLGILIGLRNIYNKDDLLQLEQHQSVDLLSASLPENKLTFHLRNDDGRWNPDNPANIEKYLMEQQEVRVRYGMDINGSVEWIKGGTFWLSERSTPSNGMEAVFTARGATEFMNVTYTGSYVGTLYEIAVAAFEEADIPKNDDGSVRYYVSEELKNYSANIPANDSEYTVAEVLQMVANAGDCVFYQDRDGMSRIEPRNKSHSDYMIEPRISYSHPEYTVSKPLKAVSVGYGGEQRAVIDVANRGEVQTVDNPFICTEEDAIRVGETAKSVLENRKVISGEFRADLRMDALDNVVVVSKYAANVIGITDITYSTTGGAFKGKYTGRVVSVSLEPDKVYSNEFYVGEI